MPDEKDDLLEAGEAVKYLAQRWGMASYSTDAFKMYRLRTGIKPDYKTQNGTLWRRSTLDKIPRPGSSKQGDEVKDDPHLVAII